jgi:hypothetical protein
MAGANILCLQVLELAVDVEAVLKRRHDGGCCRSTSTVGTLHSGVEHMQDIRAAGTLSACATNRYKTAAYLRL